MVLCGVGFVVGFWFFFLILLSMEDFVIFSLKIASFRSTELLLCWLVKSERIVEGKEFWTLTSEIFPLLPFKMLFPFLFRKRPVP